MSLRAATAGVLVALSLVACDRAAQTNPEAPGRPGTGNAPEVVRPQAGEGPPGGSTGPAGIGPMPGSSGGDAVPGTTGSGGTERAEGGRGIPPQPGVGTTGGLGTSGAGAAQDGSTSPIAPQGSPNRGSGAATGER
jgi:hypothetical protein